MVNSRETRAHAAELKFIVDTTAGREIRDWARAHLEPDPYGVGPSGDQYQTRSLYFDTAEHAVFRQQGSFGRAKYRIRRYSTSDYAFLERKLRTSRVLVKRRTRVDLSELDPHMRREVRPAEERWFFDRLAARRLQPACLVSYDRTARGVHDESGQVRLTLDENIRVAPAHGYALTGDIVEPVLSDRVIVELKFRGALPAIFKRCIERFRMQPAERASKYRFSMAALGHVVTAVAVGPANRAETARE